MRLPRLYKNIRVISNKIEYFGLINIVKRFEHKMNFVETSNHGHRKFYDISSVYDEKSRKESFLNRSTTTDTTKLINYVEQNVIGRNYTFLSPFGRRKVVYCDYTASGKSLQFIENYIQNEVLPTYGNTHTTTTVTSLQTTLFRHEARDIIRNSVNASEHDSIIFTGSGCTSAIHKLIHALKLDTLPIVFVSTFEHHSNLLPWRENCKAIIRIKESSNGVVDLNHLEENLIKYQTSNHPLIGCFSAASNITGMLLDDKSITILLHKYKALAIWDYATAAPYISVDMNPVITGNDQGLVYKDAIVLSPHKFIGGVGTPGILISKKKLFCNSIPSNGGGGSVFFVGRDRHRYLKEPEMREEGGTPDIVGSIRAGLVFQLKESITSDVIMKRENEINNLVVSAWGKTPNLILLGNHSAERLAIYSFVIRDPRTKLYLHHNFVSAILNDLFGIQARGGCACAGPYALDQLGIDDELSLRYENALLEDSKLDRVHLRRYKEYSCYEVIRPGFVRLNFPFFMQQSQVDFVIKAVQMIAENGWKLLPQYNFNPETGEWRHRTHQVFKERRWLGSISYSSGEMNCSHSYEPNNLSAPKNEENCLTEAQRVFENAEKVSVKMSLGDQKTIFTDETSILRWFLLPSEAQSLLNNIEVIASPPLFTPKSYKESVIDLIEEKTNCDSKSDQILQCPIQCRIIVPSLSSNWWCLPPKNLRKPTLQALEDFNMIQDGDRVLVCLSGGKDSLSLLHVLHQYQYHAKSKGTFFHFGAVTVDPESGAYDPSSLKSYLKSLDVPYFYEEQGILPHASTIPQLRSICSFCSRMKRGRIYACARRENYNVLAFGHHLDDLTETFFMNAFHNGSLRTMKAKYFVKEGDLKVIRPFVYVRETSTRQFAERMKLPVIAENCPGCFEAPKERHRIKQLLAQQEILFPRLFWNMRSAIKPLMEIDRCGIESEDLIRFALKHTNKATNHEL